MLAHHFWSRNDESLSYLSLSLLGVGPSTNNSPHILTASEHLTNARATWPTRVENNSTAVARVSDRNSSFDFDHSDLDGLVSFAGVALPVHGDLEASTFEIVAEAGVPLEGGAGFDLDIDIM